MDYLSIFKHTSGDLGVAAGGYVLLPDWGDQQWQILFAATTPRLFKANEFVIRRGVKENTLYLIANGRLEVGTSYVNGVSISPLASIGPGSVVGEQAFIDGQARSANVYALSSGELLCLTRDKFDELYVTEPLLMRDLLLALARILSLRLRNTTLRVGS